MSKSATSLAPNGETDDLEEMLMNGRVPTLKNILDWVSAELPFPSRATGGESVGNPKVEAGFVVLTKRSFYKGYQPDHRIREQMKQKRHAVNEESPLKAWVIAWVSFAKARWCEAIDNGETHLQFAKWLRRYMRDAKAWCAEMKMVHALELVRIACGFPPRGALELFRCWCESEI